MGFSYHLPAKSYAIFHLPSFPLQVLPPISIIDDTNIPQLPTQAIEDTPITVEDNPVLEKDYFPPGSSTTDVTAVDDVVQEQNNFLDIELQRIPTSGQNPLLLNLPPLMSPEILHVNRAFPEIELQKVPSLGEMNTIAVRPPMEAPIIDENVDLKFYDAVPKLKPVLQSNSTVTFEENFETLSDNQSERLVRLRRRRRKKPDIIHTKKNDKIISKCQFKSETTRLKSHFPKCTNSFDRLCKASKSRSRKNARLKSLGNCLIKKYPKTKRLSKLSPKVLKSGRGTIRFDSDNECTTFVHTFFSRCKTYIPSCQNVREGDRSQAKLVLGCLFSNYSRLLIPLMSVTNS